MSGNPSSLTKLMKRSFIEMMKDVGTSIPGHIVAFDAGRQLAQLQPGVERVDVNGDRFAPPHLIECPVYVYGGDWCIEVELKPGDEGAILFSQRCIDAWVQSGGVAANPILRFHDFSDAYFLPGLRSQPNRVASHANDGIRMRNAAGDRYVWLHGNGDVEIAAGDFTLNATGDVTLGGTNVEVTSGTLTHNGTNVGDDHTHSGVTTGGDNTGAPV